MRVAKECPLLKAGTMLLGISTLGSHPIQGEARFYALARTQSSWCIKRYCA